MNEIKDAAIQKIKEWLRSLHVFLREKLQKTTDLTNEISDDMLKSVADKIKDANLVDQDGKFNSLKISAANQSWGMIKDAADKLWDAVRTMERGENYYGANDAAVEQFSKDVKEACNLLGGPDAHESSEVNINNIKRLREEKIKFLDESKDIGEYVDFLEQQRKRFVHKQYTSDGTTSNGYVRHTSRTGEVGVQMIDHALAGVKIMQQMCAKVLRDIARIDHICKIARIYHSKVND